MPKNYDFDEAIELKALSRTSDHPYRYSAELGKVNLVQRTILEFSDINSHQSDGPGSVFQRYDALYKSCKISN